MEEKKKRQKFNKEFVNSAVKLVETGKSVAQVARELGLPEWRVQGWVRKSKNKAKMPANGQDAVLQELKALRKENARLSQRS